MKTLTLDAFNEWMETYGKASKDNDARASAALFALDASYYETPFSDPMIGRQAIYDYWETGARNLKDKESCYEILAIRKNLVIARWQSSFVSVSSGNHIELDCIFLVEFDDHGKCRLFREWWHSRVVEIGGNTRLPA
jgi:hypothetical protein